jgi:glycosyltransferase involved in cell wall biosynthesis
MNKRPTQIVYFGVNRWDSMVQREQHLATALSRKYRILFIDPPLSYSTVIQGKIRRQQWAFGGQVRSVHDRLIVYTPPAFLPFSQYSETMQRLHVKRLLRLTKDVLGRLSFGSYLLGVARPFLAPLIEPLRPELSYYDCADDYLHFPGLKANKKLLEKCEEDLLKSVDVVFCSSEKLRRAKTHLHADCFLLPNGVDSLFLQDNNTEESIPSDMREVKRPILGYVGTIGEWFDLEAVTGLARARPDWSIVLIGPAASSRFSSEVARASNIHWLGEKEYHRLPAYLRLFNVTLIPFKLNAFTQSIYPTKFHQYLAAGKPVLSSPLPDLERFAPPLVEFYRNTADMEVKIEKMLGEDSEEKAAQRRRVASENTWDKRAEEMIAVLDERIGKRRTYKRQ